MKPRIAVSDHAVVQYLSRAWGVDVDAIRRHLSRMATVAALHDAKAVRIDGVRLVMDGLTVVTVTGRGTEETKRAARLRARRARLERAG